jgi:transposase
VHAGNLNDRTGARLLMTTLQGQYMTLKKLWVDQGYRAAYFWGALQLERGLSAEVVLPGEFGPTHAVGAIFGPPPGTAHRYPVTPRRWVVERSFAWLGRYRRFSKDYEYLSGTSEGLIYAAMSHLMLRRLARGGLPSHEPGRRPRQLRLPFL